MTATILYVDLNFDVFKVKYLIEAVAKLFGSGNRRERTQRRGSTGKTQADISLMVNQSRNTNRMWYFLTVVGISY